MESSDWVVKSFISQKLSWEQDSTSCRRPSGPASQTQGMASAGVVQGELPSDCETDQSQHDWEERWRHGRARWWGALLVVARGSCLILPRMGSCWGMKIGNDTL